MFQRLVSHHTDTHLYIFSVALTLPLTINKVFRDPSHLKEHKKGNWYKTSILFVGVRRLLFVWIGVSTSGQSWGDTTLLKWISHWCMNCVLVRTQRRKKTSQRTVLPEGVFIFNKSSDFCCFSSKNVRPTSSPPHDLVYGSHVHPSTLVFILSSHRHSYTSSV